MTVLSATQRHVVHTRGLREPVPRLRRLYGPYGDVDLRVAIETEKREAQRQREVAVQQAASAASQQRATLGALLTAYVERLRRDNKASTRSVEQALTAC